MAPKQAVKKLLHWEWLILLALSPLLLFPTATYGLGMVALPLLWLLRGWAAGQIVPRTPLNLSLLVLVFMVGVSVLVTPDPMFSLPKVTGVLLGVAFVYALVAAMAQPQGMALMLGLFGAVTAGSAGISLLATDWAGKFPALQPFVERLPLLIRGLPGSPPEGFNPNQVAGLLLIALPLSIVLTVAPSRSLPAPQWLVRGVAALLLLVMGPTFLLTQSRAGYVGLAVALVVLVALWRPLIGAGLAGVGATGFVALMLSPLQTVILQLLTERMALWQRAVLGIQTFPLTGLGIGMFRVVQPKLAPLYLVPFQQDIGHAHNLWLQTALDVGLPGMLALAAVWLGGFVLCWQVWRTPSAGAARFIMAGLAAGWVAHGIWSLLDANALGSKGGFLWWLSLGLILGIYQKEKHLVDSA